MRELENQMYLYEEITQELRCARKKRESFERICNRAKEFLPEYEAELMCALFTEFEEQVDTEWIQMKWKFADIDMDFLYHGYDGKKKEHYEKKRLEAVKTLIGEENRLTAIRKFYELAAPLREAAKGTAYNELANSTAITVHNIEVCARLLRNGKLSLTEIVDCLPGVKMYDLYGLSEKLDIPVHPTEEEIDRIREETKKARKPEFTNLKEFMESQGMLDENGRYRFPEKEETQQKESVPCVKVISEWDMEEMREPDWDIVFRDDPEVQANMEYLKTKLFRKICMEKYTREFREKYKECIEKGWSKRDAYMYADGYSQNFVIGFASERCKSIKKYFEILKEFEIPDEEIDKTLQDVFNLTLEEAAQYGFTSEKEEQEVKKAKK